MNVRHFLETAGKFDVDLETLLNSHPESFDVFVYKAKPIEQDESIAFTDLQVTRLDPQEHLQSYDPPLAARAYIIPEDGYGFQDMTESGAAENFAESPMRLLLSVPVRKFSLVTWEEYADLTMANIVTRAVYVFESKPLGRTLNVGSLCTCYPIPDEGLLEEVQDNG